MLQLQAGLSELHAAADEAARASATAAGDDGEVVQPGRSQRWLGEVVALAAASLDETMAAAVVPSRHDVAAEAGPSEAPGEALTLARVWLRRVVSADLPALQRLMHRSWAAATGRGSSSTVADVRLLPFCADTLVLAQLRRGSSVTRKAAQLADALRALLTGAAGEAGVEEAAVAQAADVLRHGAGLPDDSAYVTATRGARGDASGDGMAALAGRLRAAQCLLALGTDGDA
jgi:hypothetical protein